MNKEKLSVSITYADTGEQMPKKTFIFEVLRAIGLYSAGVYILAALVIVILFFIFKFSILPPLLIAIPASLVLGVVIFILTIVVDNLKNKKRRTKVLNKDE